MSRVRELGPNPYTPHEAGIAVFPSQVDKLGLSAAEKPFDAMRNRGTAGRRLQCHSPTGMRGSPQLHRGAGTAPGGPRGSRLGFRSGFPIGFLGSNPRGVTRARA